MGKTSFSGPVFGAQETLWSVGPVSASTGSSAAFAGMIVPSAEDWYVSEISLYRNSSGSTNLVISLLDDSTSIGTVTVNGSSVVVGNIAVLTTDGGEFHGTKVAGGSTLTLAHSSHAGANANLCVNVYGFRRFNFTSTRAL